MSGTLTGTIGAEINLGTASSYGDPLTIAGTVDVTSGIAAINTSAPWTLANEGEISSASGYGIKLNDGGAIGNSGLIDAPLQDGIFASTGTIAITNSGTVEGGNLGILLVNAQDTLDNTGLISGGTVGVRFTGYGPDTSILINSGTIEGLGSLGIALSEATAYNGPAGLVESNAAAVYLGILSDFTNYGTVSGQTGILVGSSGGTIVDAGTIEGNGAAAISFASGAPGLLELLPGAALEGNVLGSNGAALMFGNGGTEGHMAGLGGSIANFGTIEIASGAAWEFSGTSSLAATATLVNSGTIIDGAADSLDINSPITGTGVIDVNSSALVIGNSVVSGQTIALNGANSSLILARPGLFSGTVAGFGGGNLIEVEGVGSTATVTGSLVGNVLTLSGGIAPTAITFATAPGTVDLVPLVEGTTKAYEIVAPCFAAGTAILTPGGPVPVEALREGDPVLNHRGEARPVIWHGSRRIDCRRHPRPEAVWPVLVEAGALAPGLPARDLYLSPDHALYLDEALIPVKYLVNGVSVRQVEAKSVTYHHVELAAHDVIWAESLLAETYLDCGNRRQFGKGAAIALHPDFAPAEWDAARACAPLVTTGARLAAVRQRLHERLLLRGFLPEVSGAVALSAGGRRLDPLAREKDCLSFAIPPGTDFVTIASAAAIPADTDPRSEDRRRLGAALDRISVDGEFLGPDDPRFGAGFHPPERRGRGWFRWTDGAARLAVNGAARLGFRLKGRQAGWREPGEPAPGRISSSASRWRSPA